MKTMDCRCMILPVHLMEELHTIITKVALAIIQMSWPEVPQEALMLRVPFPTLKANIWLRSRLDMRSDFLALLRPCR
jgi:hypothetical protein